MKFVIRRIAFALITAPIVVSVYASGYGLLATLANQSTTPEADVMWLIAVMYVLFILFAKQMNKLVSWLMD